MRRSFGFQRGKSLSAILLFTLISASVMTAQAHGSTTNNGGPITRFQGVASTVTQTQTLRYAPPANSNAAATNSSLHLSPAPGRGGTASAPTAATPSPQTGGLGVDGLQGGLLHNFTGLNSVDSFHVNGFVLEPPDQGLCVGSLLGKPVVAEIINDVIAFYTPSGALFGPEENLNVFFAEPSALNVSDPRCYFDPATQVFFFSAVIYTSTLIPNHQDVAVLHPDLSEFVARIDTTLPQNKAGKCPCFGDQPKLGVDASNVYVSVDQFGGPGQGLETGADLFVLSKSQLVASKSVLNEVAFLNLSLLGIGITGLQPAITNSSAGAEFLLNSFPYANEAQTKNVASSNDLGLWALSHSEQVSAGGIPQLSATIIHSETYRFPVPALTTNGKSLATFTNDDRMQQIQFINGHLWAALDSAVHVQNDTSTVDGAAWFEVAPMLAGGDIADGTFTNQGFIATAGKFLVYPAIETTFTGTTGIAFSLTSRTLNPSTGYVVRSAGSGAFGGIHLTAMGSNPDIGFTCALGFPQRCRWGDYSWAALDPNGQNLWMAAEDTVPQIAAQVVPKMGTLRTNWGTQVWDVMGNS